MAHFGCNIFLNFVWCVRHIPEKIASKCVHALAYCLLLWECVRASMCVIIMSWSEASWVVLLICISGVNHYKYSWPGSKPVWIFILPAGRRRWSGSDPNQQKKKLTKPFVRWTTTLDDCCGLFCVFSTCGDCCISLVIWQPYFHLHIIHGKWCPQDREADGERNPLHFILGQKLKFLFETTEELQGELSTTV